MRNEGDPEKAFRQLSNRMIGNILEQDIGLEPGVQLEVAVHEPSANVTPKHKVARQLMEGANTRFRCAKVRASPSGGTSLR
jgi:hypothetical protein